jgi:hypothetical protein
VDIKTAIQIGKGCGLQTLGECFENVRHHSMSIFKYTEISKELQELVDEIMEYKFKPTEKIDNIVDKLDLEWYYKTEEDKRYNAPRLKPKEQ